MNFVFQLLDIYFYPKYKEFGFAFFTFANIDGFDGSIFYIGYKLDEFDWDFLFINMIIKEIKYRGAK